MSSQSTTVTVPTPSRELSPFVLRPLPAGPPSATGRRVVAEGAYPCRRCLRDAEPGEALLLLSYDPFLGDSVYAQPGPIYVHERACSVMEGAALPVQLTRRILSVRAFDAGHLMLDARVTPGTDLDGVARAFLERPDVDYLHVHFAGPGCFAVRIEHG